MEIKILSCIKDKKGYLVEIEPKVFYVDGKGGQQGDRGTIGEANILEVREDKILIDKELELKNYSYEIDRARQEDIAKQHTAQHLFSAIAYNKYNLNTVGFRMSDEYTTVDLDSNTLDEEIIENLERETNRVINEGIELKIFTLSHEKAMEVEGLRKAIKEKVTGDVRFIEIPEVDLSACAGFHVKNTKDIGLFKILYSEKIKGNYTRFYFIAGQRAYRDYSYKHMLGRELCHLFSCKESEILDKVDKVLEDKKKLESQNKDIALKYAEYLSKDLLLKAKEIDGCKILIYVGEKEVGQVLNRFIDEEKTLLIVGAENNYSVISKKIDCKELIKYLMGEDSEIKGGGSQIKGNFKGNIEKEKLESLVFKYLNK